MNNLETVAIIPLAQAQYCETCQMLSNTKVNCPVCDSAAHLHPLAAWLDRQQAVKAYDATVVPPAEVGNGKRS